MIDIIEEFEVEWLVVLLNSALKEMADHIKAHILVGVGSLDDVIRNRESVGVGVSKLEASNLEVNHIEIVSKALLNLVVGAGLEGRGPVKSNLLSGLVAGLP